ncbi:MAG TPA: hypothetical protein VFQ74_10790 [Pseudolysinimonas sp.]|nr:hypothetical protein [Pseudolysinimonas sp.]
MKLFRRTKRVNVGTYTDPIPTPPPDIEAQIEDGVLVALAAVRLAITNRLIVRSLRDGKDYDEQRVRLRVTKEILDLALEKEKDAKRIRKVLETVGDKPGVAIGPDDFRARDAKTLKRRAKVSSGLAARLAELATDPELVGEVADRAHRAFLDEFAVSVAQGVRAFEDSTRGAPLTTMDRTAELQRLSEDLEELSRDRRAAAE